MNGDHDPRALADNGVSYKGPTPKSAASARAPAPRLKETAHTFFGDPGHPALKNWKEAARLTLSKFFKTDFASFEAANQHYAAHLGSLGRKTAQKLARKLFDVNRKAFYRAEYRDPSFNYTDAEMTRLKGGAAPRRTFQLEHLEAIKDQLRKVAGHVRTVLGRPERAFDPANVYGTEGGPRGGVPEGSPHHQKDARLGPAEEVADRRLVRDKRATTAERGTGEVDGSGTRARLRSMAANILIGELRSRLTEAAIEARAEAGEYVPYGPLAYADENLAFRLFRFSEDPTLGAHIPLEKRLKMSAWRENLRHQAAQKRAGERLSVTWQYQARFGAAPAFKDVTIVYRKLRSGKWISQMSGSDDWPANRRVPEPPDLNRIIDPKWSDQEVERLLGLSTTGEEA